MAVVNTGNDIIEEALDYSFTECQEYRVVCGPKVKMAIWLRVTVKGHG